MKIMKNKTLCLIIALIIISIAFFVLLYFHFKEKYRNTKLFGGLGYVNGNTGSTINIDEQCKCRPYIPGEYVYIAMNRNER